MSCDRKSSRFRVSASIVAYPPHFPALAGWLDAFRGEGLRCHLNPFQGVCADREYPRSYTEEESSFLRRHCFPDALGLRLGERRPFGRLCRAGWKYFRIWPDGVIHRCCAATELGQPPLGHIRDTDLPMASAPAPCLAQRCFAPNEVICLV